MTNAGPATHPHPLATYYAALTAYFTPDEIDYKPGRGGGKLPYVKAPAIMDRLDRVIGPGNWSVHALIADPDSGAVQVTLTILGVSMTDFGDANNPMGGDKGDGAQAFKEAASDGLKRAARLFGIGRYLWQMKPGQPLPTPKPAAPAAAAPVKPSADVHSLDGVAFTYDPRDASGRTLKAVELCPTHQVPFYAKVRETGEMTAWAHRQGEGVCQRQAVAA